MICKKNFLVSNLLVLIFVIGCGGGGGGGGTPTPSEPSPTSSLSSSSSSVLIDTAVTLTWSSTNATSCSASGTWSGTKATSGSEDVTIATPGNNQFTITCSGAGGSRAASVTVEGYRNTEGVTVDGYIRQADIFIDTNDSYTADSGEDTTTSDNDGKFTIKYSDGNLISLGGTDLDSGNALDNLLIVHKLTGHSNFKAVTPVTSVAAFMTDSSLVNAALGIDVSLDIATVDPVAGKGDGGINDYLYEKGNQLTVLAYALQNITNNLNTTTDTTQDYFKAIAEELDTEYAATATRVNIETEAFITKVLNNVVNIKSLTLDDTNKANAISALAAVLPVIQVKADSANTTAIFDFATSTLQTDAQALANGTASAATVTSYQTDILNYVADDQNVVADELVPDISALPDSVTIDEDSSIDIAVLANDSYNTTESIDVVLDTSPSDGSASLSNNVVSYVPDANFFGSDEIAYTITQGDKTSSSSVAISINSVNDVPTFDNLLSTYTVDENQTAVTSISASDVEDEALTISISGTDEASFNLSSSNILTFVESPDYETQISYSLVASVTDGIDTLNKDVTVNLYNLNDNLPVFTSSSSFSADENQTAIGVVVASDADGDSVTYTASGSDILIDGGTGVITFSSAPDYETKTSFTSTVTATDGLNSSTQDITIAVNNLNDNYPELVSAAYFEVDENQTSIGTISATDADGDTLTYAISGSESSGINIDPDSGVLTFVDAPDYETKTSYSFDGTVSDAPGRTVSFLVQIKLNNLNDNSPIFTSAETFSVAENESSIGTALATDADTGSSVSYSVDNSVTQKVEVSVAANANGSGNVYVISGVQKKSLFLEVGKTYSFEHPTAHPLRFSTTADGTNGSGTAYTDGVDTSTDGITLLTVSADTPAALYYYCSIHAGMGSDATPSSSSFPAVSVDASSGVLTFSPRPDFETLASFSAQLSASDGEIVINQDIQVNITDVDPEGPVFSTPSSFNADENQTDIGTVAAEDPFGDAVTYSLSGTDADSISIDSSSGVLTFNSAPDYETKNSYLIIITADGSIADTLLNVTVNVNNLNDNSPVLTSGTTFSGAENQTEVGSVTALDADGDVISYSVSGTDLSINSEGVITFSTAPDYESTTSFTATITATDGTFSDTQNITVNVTDIDDVAPVITSSASFSAVENQTSIGTVTATDVDSSSTSFSVSGEGLSMSTSGVLTFSTAPDFETQSSYSGTVTATDGINSSAQSITVTVINVNEAPVFTSGTLYDADENQSAIGNVTATDVDSSSLTYSVSGSELLMSNDGVLTFVSAPDYETKSSFTATVTVTDGGLSVSQPITVTINNLNDNSPVLTSGTDFTIDENTSAVGTVSGSDADGDVLAYSISGTDADSLSIDSSTGVLSFNEITDYETKTSYSLNLIISDGVNSATNAATISINNLNDNSPIFTSAETFSVAENESSIGTALATDADTGSSVSYSVDNSVTQKVEVSVAANANGSGNVYVISGVQKKSLFLEVGKTYSFEHPTAHPLRFSTTADGTNGSGTAYTDGVDTSTDGITLLTVSADTPAALYYYCSIHAGMGSDATPSSSSFPAVSVDASSGVLTFSPRPDFETLASFSAQLSASDGEIVINQDIQVNITDVDPEGPVFSTPSSFNADENQTDIGTVAAEDPFGDAVTYSLSGTDADSISIDSSSGVLTFNSGPDFETKSSYLIIVTAIGSIANTEQDITVNINNLNDNSPVISGTSTYSADENQTSIGSIAASDADGDSLTYSVSNSDLSISPEGVLTFNTSPDYETVSTYSAIITVSDGVYSDTKDITIDINNLNDNSPVFTSSASLSAEENQTSIGTITATDADNNPVSFAVDGSDDGSELSISSAGVLRFISAPDFETKSSYTATVTAYDSAVDGSNSSTQIITVTIINVNEVPIITSGATYTVDENQTSIGTFEANDVDGDSLSYSISGSELSINSSGILSFNSAPDFESKSSYSAEVEVSDGNLSASQLITVNINNLNDEAPVFVGPSTFNINENNTNVGTAFATDADNLTAITFTISGSDFSLTSTGSSSAKVEFISAPDYETKTQYNATITANDGVNTSTVDWTINIINLNDNAPVYTSSNTFNANENQTAIGSVTASDADGNSLTFSTSSSELSITSAGTLTFATAPDYETKSSYTATVSVTDGVYTETQDITVNVNDVNDAPVFTSGTSFALNNGDTSITTVSATDEDGNSLAYSLSGTDASAMTIDATSGALTLNASADYATKSSYSVTAEVTDGAISVTQAIAVTVNAPPTATSAGWYVNVLPKDSNGGDIQLAGTAISGRTLTYSIVTDPSLGTATLDSATGIITYATTRTIAGSDTIVFKTNDGFADSANGTITIDIKTDPLYKYQWHLDNTGQTNFASTQGTIGADLNVDGVIAQGYTGYGVLVAVVDEGLELAHEDLTDNVVCFSDACSYDLENNDYNPTNSSLTGDHGTSVAGIIASRGWNDKGGRGVAPKSNLVGYNFLKYQCSTCETFSWGTNNALAAAVSIFNLSYGSDGYGNFSTSRLPAYMATSTEDALKYGVGSLRSGKGALYVKSNGNGFRSYSVNGTACGQQGADADGAMACTLALNDSSHSVPYILGTAAIGAKDTKSSYSTPGASTWISSYGGEYGYNSNYVSTSSGIYDPAIMTVDQTGCTAGYVGSASSPGYNFNEFNDHTGGFSENSSCSYSSSFNGTSSAAPNASGAIALILESNPNLTWRDVKHILASTSRVIDADRTYTRNGVVQYEWETNAAGYKHHYWYGFGAIDMNAAVEAAKAYTAGSLGTFVTSGYVEMTTNTATGNLQYTDFNSTSINAASGGDDFVEFVRVSINLDHSIPRDVGLELISPQGTVVNIMQPFSNIGVNPKNYTFDIGVAAFYGEQMSGVWQLRLTEYTDDGVQGALLKWGIEVYGH